MFSKVKLYEQRYRELNEYRLAKAQEFVNEKGKLFFNLVPLMLHLNNSAVPCALAGDVPHGICNFKLNDIQRQVLDDYSVATASVIDINTAEESILGLYCMGSTASVGQSPNSDFDYWVCVSEYMPNERIRLLEKKCKFIKEMAASSEYKLDVNFFIVKTDKFKQHLNVDKKNAEDLIDCGMGVDEENCGTALHMFLLDEFYRSAICVAGKMLTWMIVPCSHEHDYNEYVRQLYAKRIISRDEWLDLGCIGDIPSNEYYGAALWLLYKGIDSPFKASIKILLMETYSAEYPQTQLISMRVKDWMQNNEGYSLNLDSYYMVFEKISRFLRNHNDYERLELLRICFFQKINEGFAKIVDPQAQAGRRTLINNMIEAWGWSMETVSRLSNRNTWNIVDVVNIYQRVFNVMIQSYHALLTFGVEYKVTDAISYRDLSVLSRKLFVVFDSFPGKVKQYLLSNKLNLAEKNISFIEARDSTVLKKGWYVYNKSLNDPSLIGTPPIFYFSNLVSAVATCYFNALINKKTVIEVHTPNKNITSERVRGICNELKSQFENYPSVVGNNSLLGVTNVKTMIVLVNFTQDPTRNHKFQGGMDRSSMSTFSYGNSNECLIGSLSVIMSNSWNEIICNHYEGQDAVEDFLKEMSHIFIPGAALPVSTTVLDFSTHMGDVMVRPDMENLINLCMNNLHKKLLTSKNITIGKVDYILQFNSRAMNLVRAEEVKEKNPIKAEIINRGEANKDLVPSIIEANCMYGLTQYFFVKNDNDSYQIFNSSENQELKIYDNFKASISELILDITSYYTHSQSKFAKEKEKHKYRQYFNLPQFFLVDVANNTISPL